MLLVLHTFCRDSCNEGGALDPEGWRLSFGPPDSVRSTRDLRSCRAILREHSFKSSAEYSSMFARSTTCPAHGHAIQDGSSRTQR